MLAVLSSDGKNQRSPGPGSEERQRSSRQPRTPLRGTHPGRLCQNAGADGAADCLLFYAAAADLAVFGKRSGWNRKTRRLQAAVGVGLGAAGGETPPLRRGWVFRCRSGFWPPIVHDQPNNMAPARRNQGEGRAFYLFHARAQWPGRRVGSHSGFARRKEVLAEGAEKTAFWFLCRREQRNPPPGRRNSPF